MNKLDARAWVAWVAVAMISACGPDEDSGSWDAPNTGVDSAGDAMPADEDEDEDEDDGQTDDSASDPGGGDDDPATSGGDEPPPDDDMGDDAPATTGPPGGGDGPPADEGGDGNVDPSLMQCLDMAASDCEDCACNNCLSQVIACQDDPGCIAIRMCAQQNGCTGIACLGPCGEVIDANGGPFGPSVGLASTLSDCYTGACPGC